MYVVIYLSNNQLWIIFKVNWWHILSSLSLDFFLRCIFSSLLATCSRTAIFQFSLSNTRSGLIFLFHFFELFLFPQKFSLSLCNFLLSISSRFSLNTPCFILHIGRIWSKALALLLLIVITLINAIQVFLVILIIFSIVRFMNLEIVIRYRRLERCFIFILCWLLGLAFAASEIDLDFI